MTNKEIKTLSSFYKTRIESLDLAIEATGSTNQTTTVDILGQMRREYQFKLDALSDSKEYMITFKGGGWNTIQAYSDEDALYKAKTKYDGEHTKVQKVYLSTPDAKEAAMNLFH
jgi:hypothetical protein